MKFIVIAFISLWNTCPGITQEINLDKGVRAGELTLYPILTDTNAYYYVPNKIKLATGKDGLPQFSFMKYVENVKTGSKEEAQREGDGGGLVHALVEYSVTDEQKQEARSDLMQINPKGRIVGPIIYRAGRFGLVSSFQQENGDWTQKVLGLGSAPILEGDKAAISIRLTREGAKILWEQFKMATPDITFKFEMDVAGYRMPVRAKIEANFDMIYKHKMFDAAVAYPPYFAAEVKLAFDELRNNGAIKITQVGSDANMESLISNAYNKLTDMMLVPAGGTGNPLLSQMIGKPDGQLSALDRATQMASGNMKSTGTSGGKPGQDQNKPGGGQTTKPASKPATPSKDAATQPGVKPPAPAPKSGTVKSGSENAGKSVTGAETAVKEGDKDKKSDLDNVASIADDVSKVVGKDSKNEKSGAKASKPGQTGTGPGESGKIPPTGASNNSDKSKGSSIGGVAMFEMKKVKLSGKQTISLEKWNPDRITIPFDENIGDMSKLMNNPKHFAEVNLDDPLFRQREVVAFVDGYNASEFTRYINFISVKLHKVHEKGDITDEEVRIDKYNFNDDGNYFKMVYGWKNDDDRDKWLVYQYEVLWSFIGDNIIKEDMKTTTFNTINLSPPLIPKTVELQAEELLLTTAGVRLITVYIYNKTGEKENVSQGTINPATGVYSQRIDYLAPKDDMDYDYEITWRLTGNRVVKSGRLSSNETVLFVDEIPEM